jgi:hypothetical protein
MMLYTVLSDDHMRNELATVLFLSILMDHTNVLLYNDTRSRGYAAVPPLVFLSRDGKARDETSVSIFGTRRVPILLLFFSVV